MIRLFILVLTALLAASCQEKGYLDGDGVNPLDKCVVSESVQPGMEAVVQWNGFDASASLYLRGEDGKEYGVEVTVVTASGLIFRVPSGVRSGTYTLMLEQVGNPLELGVIEVLESDLPVTGIKLPSAVEPDKDFIIEGVGFTDSFSVFASDADRRVSLECTLISKSQMEVSMPAGMPSGIYSLYLSDGTDEWLLSESFYVTVRKSLSSISLTSPYQNNVRYRVKYEVERENGQVKAIVYTTAQVENGVVIQEEAHDRYILESDGVFRAEGGSSSSNNFNFGYTYDSSGNILYADVLRYSRNNPEGTMRRFTYLYNSDGTPSNVTYELDGVTRSMQMWFYEDGNLTESKFSTIFLYEDESLKNNPFAQDFVVGYFAFSDVMEPFLYAPYLVGNHPFVSRLLPSAFNEDPGNGVISRADITYAFDDDGYVSEAKWRSGSYHMEFAYVEP